MFNGKSFGILCAEESSGMSLSFLSVAAAVALPVYCVQQGLIKSKQPLGLSLQLSNVIALQLGDHHRSMFGSGIFRQIRKGSKYFELPRKWTEFLGLLRGSAIFNLRIIVPFVTASINYNVKLHLSLLIKMVPSR